MALKAQLEAFQQSALATDRASAQAAMAAPDALLKHSTGLQALLDSREQQVAQLQVARAEISRKALMYADCSS